MRLDNSVGDQIVVVKATDDDSGVMGNVTYSIFGGSGADYFNVGVISGNVTMQCNQGCPQLKSCALHFSNLSIID